MLRKRAYRPDNADNTDKAIDRYSAMAHSTTMVRMRFLVTLCALVFGCTADTLELCGGDLCDPGLRCIENSCTSTPPPPPPAPACDLDPQFVTVSRHGATMSYLPENKRVLIVGGAKIADGVLEYPRVVELYNPSTCIFEQVGELRSGGARAFHAATMLDDGRVLMTGGEAHVSTTRESLRSAVLIDAKDPLNVQISSSGLAMQQARTEHTATKLSDGRLLLVGGRILNPASGAPEDQTYLTSIELYNPQTGVFERPEPSELPEPRYGHSATPVDGGVLIAGGSNADGLVPSILYLSVQDDQLSMQRVGELGEVGPFAHSAIEVAGGVLLAGGYTEYSRGLGDVASVAVEVWGVNGLRCSATLETARAFAGGARIKDTVSIFGGQQTYSQSLSSAERLTLDETGCPGAPRSFSMAKARSQPQVIALQAEEKILVCGGLDNAAGTFSSTVGSCELF